MIVSIVYPALSILDCDTCRAYEIEDFRPKCYHGTKKPIPRDQNSLCDCERPNRGCPIGNYDQQNRLTTQNLKAYHHYLECKAVSRFPDDGVVTQNAGIIYRAEQIAERLLHARYNSQSNDSPRT